MYLLFSCCEKYRAGIPRLCDDHCEMSGCRGRSHGTSVAQDCVSLKDSHVDFLFKHAR